MRTMRMTVLAHRADRFNRITVKRTQHRLTTSRILNHNNLNPVIAASSSSEAETSEEKRDDSSSIKQTMADLDALLGIEEKEEVEEDTKKPVEAEQIAVSISPDALAALADAEAKRAGASTGNTEVNKKVSDSITRIVEQARKLQESSNEDDTAGEQAMRKEFEQLLTVITSPRELDPNEIKILKEQVFGPQTFWVTETAAAPGFDGGIVVRGNFRGKKDVVFADVCQKVETFFGDKYVVKLIEENDFSEDGDLDQRSVFLILPTPVAIPPPVAGWQRGVATVLLGLTLFSALQLGLAANVGFLPKETLRWLANPDNLNSEILPPGLENFDPVPFLKSSVAVGGVALLPQLAHELGHVIAAQVKGLKISPSFLIPNGQLGTFGSITQLKSLAKNRTDLFDFAVSGLGAGGIASLILFIYGLIASHNGVDATSATTSVVDAGLVPVPSVLFQGSLLLGGLCKAVLGADAMAKTNVLVSPALIGGWCGLVATALNALPVGNLDGGRVMLAAYGRSVLAFTSLATYVGLGLGLLGNALALPFGLFILICQREAEKNIQDEVSEIDSRRKTIALVVAVMAVLVLLPGVPDAADMLLGGPTDFL